MLSHQLHSASVVRALASAETAARTARCAVTRSPNTHYRERVVHRRIVGLHRIEFGPSRNAGLLCDRHPELAVRVRIGNGRTPRRRLMRGAQRLPCLNSRACSHRSRAPLARTPRPLSAGLAPALLPRLPHKQGAARPPQRVVLFVERIDAAIAVKVDADIEPHLWHPLGVLHRAGRGADHVLCGVAAVLPNDLQRVLDDRDLSSSRIAAAARPTPQRGQERWKQSDASGSASRPDR